MHVTREVTLCFVTAFCAGDQSPISLAVALASECATGLYARHWIASPCVYLRMPSALAVQIIMVLSAPPDANRFPSRAYATAYSTSLCPLSDESCSPLVAS